MDTMLSGMHDSDLLVLAARPSMGKTSLALNIAENVAFGTRGQEAFPVAIFSLKMPVAALVRKMACARAGVPECEFPPGQLWNDNAKLRAAVEELAKSEIPLFVDDTAGLEVPDLLERARKLKKENGIRLVIVDYLELMRYSEHAREGVHREMGATLASMKELAKELQRNC